MLVIDACWLQPRNNRLQFLQMHCDEQNWTWIWNLEMSVWCGRARVCTATPLLFHTLHISNEQQSIVVYFHFPPTCSNLLHSVCFGKPDKTKHWNLFREKLCFGRIADTRSLCKCEVWRSPSTIALWRNFLRTTRSSLSPIKCLWTNNYCVHSIWSRNRWCDRNWWYQCNAMARRQDFLKTECQQSIEFIARILWVFR